ncbi:MAG: sigma-54-dependent Fis family transcriptional regulator [Planctomycetes bacterium]|nr:sigma-54-dependent Fis family transcriptional regulator [Planctomycetota bacterium]
MTKFSAADVRQAEVLRRLTRCNPFGPERIALEREALGDDVRRLGPSWHLHHELHRERIDAVTRLAVRSDELARRMRDVLERSGGGGADARSLYVEVALFALYHEMHPPMQEAIAAALTPGRGRARTPPFDAFQRRSRELLEVGGKRLPEVEADPHLFALIFQLNRAFFAIYHVLVGASKPMVELRQQIWQSIFTHDLQRYRKALYARLGDVPTLITGPSGSGKELVARAIAYSRYVPYDVDAGKFVARFVDTFHAINLSASSPTLVESELFGHRKGAFTGALADRVGFFARCSPYGSVFLDEIGDLDPAIQVKLLRVLQSREFAALGDDTTQRFDGKVVAAPNRDLPALMRERRFREDLYYRLCADRLVTPSLRDQLVDQPDDLPRLVGHVARQWVEGDDADRLTAECIAFVDGKLGRGYAWPGNFRELEQCVRSVMLRGEYTPAETPAGDADVTGRLVREFTSATLTAEQMLSRYVTYVYSKTHSYDAAARALDCDRRTVRARVLPELVRELRTSGAGSVEPDGSR